jgi:hypothetical protein
MDLYHRTYAAEAIIRDGFHDGAGSGLRPDVVPGVFVSDQPLDERDGALGNVVLVISGVPESEISRFEWLCPDDMRSFREFVIPAAVLNRFPIVGIYPDTWLWFSGNFEYVGSLIDMRPFLTHAPGDDEPAGRVENPLHADGLTRD